MGVPVDNDQSLNYGCMGVNHNTHEVVHYIEKPSTFVSNDINGGVYLLSVSVFDDISAIFKERADTGKVEFMFKPTSVSHSLPVYNPLKI